MDDVDKKLVNLLQDGIEVCERPFAHPAAQLGIGEAEVVARLKGLLEAGVLTRFGPMYNVDQMDRWISLVAMQVPRESFDEVAAVVNSYPEVAHNYEREHPFNMWFVLATSDAQEGARILTEIKARTGLEPCSLPKEQEYFVGFKVRL